MSRIIVNTCVFPPEPVHSSKTSESVTKELAKRGHQIAVITSFPSRPAGKLFPGYKRALFSNKGSTDQIHLVRCFSFQSGTSSMISRWLENISFGLTSSLALLFWARPDVIYVNTWPIFATGFITLVSKMRKVPIVIHVQDMYPESLVIQGRLKSSQLLYKILMLIDKWIAEQSSAQIVLSKSFSEGYTRLRHIKPSKVHVIPNWVDSGSVVVLGKNIYRQELGISKDAFVLVYGGNIGMAAGVEMVIDALGEVNATREIVLVIAGSGSQLADCRELTVGKTNVQFIFYTPWAADETSKILSVADVLILPTRGNQSLASVPSKLLSYMLSARPVLAVVLPQSDTAIIIEKAGAGWIVPPDNINLLTKKVEELNCLSERLLENMGSSGRKYALNQFTTETCLPKVIDIIDNVIRNG